MNKKLFIFAGATFVTALSVTLISNIKNSSLNLFADECEHVGYHYDQKDPTSLNSGWKEFYSCCKCGQSWLTMPRGTFEKGYESIMTGGVGEGHVAYLPPLGNKPSVPYNYDFSSKENRQVDMCQPYIRRYLDATTLDKQFEYAKYSVSDSGANIDSKEAGGTQNLGITWNDDGSSSYDVYIADNAEFKGYWKTTTTDLFLNDGICYPGKDYYYMVYGNDQTSAVSYGRFHTLENTPRFVYIPGETRKTQEYMTCGLRDLGGWPTMYGTRTSYGRIYRGAQFYGERDQNSSNATAEGLKIASQDLGIKCEIDLRENDEAGYIEESLIEGASYHRETITSYKYLINTSNPTRKFINIFELLADESNYPVYFHCVAGADRTGTLSFFINSLLGVGSEDLFRDFELKTFACSGGTRNREDLSKWNASATFVPGHYESDTSLNALIDACSQLYPETTVWSEKMYRIMNEFFGVPTATLNEFLRINLGFVPQKYTNSDKVTVSFANADIAPIQVYKGTALTNLPVASKIGYLFDKWLDVDGNPYDITTIVNDDLTLVASYKKVASGNVSEDCKVSEWSIYDLMHNQGIFKVERTFNQKTRIYTREENRYSYKFNFPKLNYMANTTYTINFESHWAEQKLAIDGVDVSPYLANGNKGESHTMTIERGGLVYFDNTYMTTLSYDVRHGVAPLELEIKLKVLSSSSSLVMTDIYSSSVDYRSELNELEQSLSSVDVSNISDSDVQEYISYSNCLKYLTEYEKENYVKPASITEFESAISDKICTVTYLNNLTGETYVEKVILGSVLSDYYQFESKDYTFAYYSVGDTQYDFSNPITGDLTLTSNYYTYNNTNVGTKETVLNISDGSVANVIGKDADSHFAGGIWPSTGSDPYCEFATRDANYLDFYAKLPLINFNKYNYVEFKVSPRNVKHAMYVDGTKVIDYEVSSSHEITIKEGKLFVDGVEKVTLNSMVLNGMSPLTLKFEKQSKESSVGSVRIFNLYAYKIATSAKNNVVTFLTNGVETGSINVLNGNTAYDACLCNSNIEGVEVAYYTLNGEQYDMSSEVTSDISLEAIYRYQSKATGTSRTAKQVYELSFEGYPEYRGLYGDDENTVSQTNSYSLSSFTFQYWTSDVNNLTQFAFGNKLTSNVTLYAVWKNNETNQLIILPNGGKGAEAKPVVTFHGTSVTQEVIYGSTVNEIDPPSEIASKFAYWTLDGEEFDFSTQITEDITLYPAYWENANTVTEYETLLADTNTSEIFNKFVEVNNASNFSYILISGGATEFGTRLTCVTDYEFNIMKFKYNDYGIVSFDIKNGWTNADYYYGETKIINNIAANTAFNVQIIGTSLYINGNLIDGNLSSAILNGEESLSFKAVMPTDNASSCVKIMNFYTYNTLNILTD